MSLAERIAGKLHCLGCGRLYQTRDLQLVGVGEDELDLYLHCHACGFHLRLSIPEREGSSRALAAALMPVVTREERKETAIAPVSAEDVSQMREFLSNFNGDVASLLSGRCEGT